MKALMKNDAAHLFKKYQRPKEDTEALMNQIQDKLISKAIGISDFQIAAFADFFEQLHKIKLPDRYTRYLNDDKNKVIYRNEVQETESTVHPSLNLIKTLFYHLLTNNKAVHTLSTKQRKLLPFVQEKMMRQSIGINSKRKEAEKANLQRDQDGKMVLSKLARVPPDVQRLIGSRSYLLKMLVQKVYTKRQIWGKGKRAATYANVLATYHSKMKHNQPDKEEDDNQTETSLQMYQSIFKKAASFYKQEFGNVDTIPKQVMKTQLFRKGTPDSVMRNMKILNIDKNSMQMYWLARMMDCLPLPPLWSLKLGTSYSQFIYEPNNLLFEIHPSYIYIMQQMNNFRSNFNNMDPMQQNYYYNMRQMMFYDYFQRPYLVDIYGAVNKYENLQKHQTSSKKMKKFLMHGGVANLVSCDWLIIQGVRNSQIRNLAYVLLENIESFWKSKNFGQETYSPAISPYGQVLWSSNVTGKCISYCPYKNQLTLLIKKQSQKLPQITQKDIKQQLVKLEQEHYRIFVEDIQEERVKFLKYYLIHDPLPLPYPYQVRLQQEHDFFDNHFTSIFDLQADLPHFPGKVPFWLQKVHASKMTKIYCNILDYSPQSFQQMLKQFVKYSMQSTKVHEPTRLQQVEMKIAKINDAEQLKQFIRQFNDLDARQQRKRQLLLQQQKSEDDIFGSSISNIDIQQRRQQQNERENIQDSEESFSESSVQVKQPIIKIQQSESQQEDANKILEIQRVIIEQPVQEEKQQVCQYKGKIYDRIQDLQRLTDQQLDDKIRKMAELAMKRHKYGHIQIRHQVSNLKYSESIKQSILRQQKQNIIVSKHDSFHSPYKHFRFVQNQQLKKKNSSRYKHSHYPGTPAHLQQDRQEFTPFESQMSSYYNDQVINEIQKWKLQHRKEQPASELQSSFQNPQRHKGSDETHHTIVLEPLKRIKPNIDEDPKLQHIDNLKLNNLPTFGRTFSQFSGRKQQFTPKKRRFQKSGSVGSLSKVKNSTNDSQTRSTLFKNEKMKNIQTDKFAKANKQWQLLNKKLQKVAIRTQGTIKRPQRTDITLPFNRVCLQRTANHFISSQAVLKRGDLIVLQARKTLIAKNRGLGTYISKKY